LVASVEAPIIFFAQTFSIEATGQLSMALMVIALPMSMFGQNVARAYFAEASRIGARDSSQLYILTKEVVSRLLVLGLVPAAALFMLAEDTFTIIFGNSWSLAGEYASILSFSLLAQFITAPVTSLFNIIERNSLFLIFSGIRFIAMLLIFLAIPSIVSISATQAVFTYSIVMTVFYLGIYVYIMWYLRSRSSGDLEK
jgi:O-antigen/teichoic acid export membrane protein